jgi:SIR2-like protein
MPPITELDALKFAMHSSKGGYALLLGSGVSRSAGVMTGWELIGDLIRRLAAVRRVGAVGDPYAWYREECGGREPSYSEVVAALALAPADRRQLLRGYFEATEADREQGRKVPTRAHRAIARLAARGHVRVIVTTNFDPLAESALEAEGVVPAVVSTPDQIEGLPPLRDLGCLVVKPHGDYRDERIKNTPEELATYDERVSALLQRLFEDYGLLVCGWSADWDPALCQTLERSRLRGTMYWTVMTEPSLAAANLVTLKHGRFISIASADDFFDDLADSMAGMDDYQTPHPASLEMLLAQTKLYLSEPRYRIRLTDLVEAEVEACLGQLREQGLFAPHGIADHDGYIDRMRRMDAASERLVTVIEAVSRWGGPEEGQLLVRVVGRLADQPSEGGQTVALHLRFYPALRVIYGAGMAAVAVGNYVPFAALSKLQVPGPQDDRRGSVLVRLQPYGVLDGKILQSHLGVHAPISGWMAGSLKPSYERAVGSSGGFDGDLDRFEYLAALLMADAAGAEEWFFPLGRFAIGGRGGRGAMAEAEQQLESEQNAWPPLIAGLFGGDSNKVRSATTRVAQKLAQLGPSHGVWGWR